MSPPRVVKINLPSLAKAVFTPSSGDESKNKNGADASTVASSSTTIPFVTLRDMDIVCGRGAPTNYHIGNESFRELVSDYHTSYFCAKRSDKPHIAMKVIDVLQSRGARFVRRQKGGCASAVVAAGGKGSSYWEEVLHKVAYEKVCQALRDGAPEVQRQILSSTLKTRASSSSSSSSSAALSSNKKKRSKSQEMIQRQSRRSNSNVLQQHHRGGGVTKGGTPTASEQGKEN